jgi:hypothetical protein
MRKIRYTSVEVQCSVLVVGWQGIAPNGLLAAIVLKAKTGVCLMSLASLTAIGEQVQRKGVPETQADEKFF